MIFTSWSFLVFLAITLLLYFVLSRRRRWQNILLLVASYISYSFWDWRFLGLLVSMTAVNYAAGWAIGRQPEGESGRGRKRFWLGMALVFDLCVLGAFKYFNFFDASLVALLSSFGRHVDPISLNVVLPLGISFFTFMAITYPFDIYRGTLTHTKDFPAFALFVAFFPTIVSGPVERAAHMLPQFQAPRVVTSDKISEGLSLIIWGFFQKIVIADNMAVIANQVFDNYTDYHGLDLAVGILAYTVQILADFSGYTDIARGVARLFGFELLLNFNVPYIALNPSDFWARWHISLSQWFRDYLYIPLGGSRKGAWRTSLNLFITMVLVGLWHGAAVTFILWGAWHGLIQVVYRLFGERVQSTDRRIYGWKSIVSIAGRTILMFILVAAGWVVFRSTSFEQLTYMFTNLGLETSSTTLDSLWKLAYFTLPLIVVQVFQVQTTSPVVMVRLNPWVRGIAYGILLVGIMVLSQHQISRFIYQGF